MRFQILRAVQILLAVIALGAPVFSDLNRAALPGAGPDLFFFVEIPCIALFLILDRKMKCPHCGKKLGYGFRNRCPHCSGLL